MEDNKITIRFPIPYEQTYSKVQIEGIITTLQWALKENENVEIDIFDENGNKSDYELFKKLNESKTFDTPDWILVKYLVGCLDNFGKTAKAKG